MKACHNCGHHDADHIPATPPEPFNTERWTVAKCFHWDGEYYCQCEQYEEQ